MILASALAPEANVWLNPNANTMRRSWICLSFGTAWSRLSIQQTGSASLFPVVGTTSATSLYYAAGTTPVVGVMNHTLGVHQYECIHRVRDPGR